MKSSKKIFLYILITSVFLTVTVFYAGAGQKKITFFAAASTTNAVTEIVNLYESRGLGKVQTSFASSSTLAKQIANGAPADIYLSANKKWMDYLEEMGAIEHDTRSDILGNRIALIVPVKSSIQKIDIAQGMNISSFLGSDGRMAMGDPDHVPAGMYGKKALENLGLWNQVSGRIAPMKDVRAALVMVEMAETPVGLVYTTDAAVSKKVRVAGIFPLDCHPKILYPVSIVAGRKSDASKAFLDFLKTRDAREIFKKYGFEVK